MARREPGVVQKAVRGSSRNEQMPPAASFFRPPSVLWPRGRSRRARSTQMNGESRGRGRAARARLYQQVQARMLRGCLAESGTVIGTRGTVCSPGAAGGLVTEPILRLAPPANRLLPAKQWDADTAQEDPGGSEACCLAESQLPRVSMKVAPPGLARLQPLRRWSVGDPRFEDWTARVVLAQALTQAPGPLPARACFVDGPSVTLASTTGPCESCSRRLSCRRRACCLRVPASNEAARRQPPHRLGQPAPPPPAPRPPALPPPAGAIASTWRRA